MTSNDGLEPHVRSQARKALLDAQAALDAVHGEWIKDGSTRDDATRVAPVRTMVADALKLLERDAWKVVPCCQCMVGLLDGIGRRELSFARDGITCCGDLIAGPTTP